MTASLNDGIYEEYAQRYPPLITVEQAAEIAHVPKATIHAWSSANRLDEIKIRCGRRILLKRDSFVRFVLAGG
jgi:excisionase family DNA binding protein